MQGLGWIHIADSLGILIGGQSWFFLLRDFMQWDIWGHPWSVDEYDVAIPTESDTVKPYTTDWL